MPDESPAGEPRACPPPDPNPRGASRYKLPEGAADTHAHLIGLPPRYPFVANRSYTPPEAPLEKYLAMLDASGMAFGGLTQVSVHGAGNRLLIEGLQAHPERLRSVAVAAADAPERELVALKDAGVVGLRLNVLFGGGIGFEALARYGALCRDMEWHLQLLLDARQLPELASKLSKLPVEFLVDHMGYIPASEGTANPGFRTLLSLVRDGAWVRLSGAFRTSVQGPPYADTIPFARALQEASPDRCLWGSDWPHVAHYGPMPNVGDLLDLVADWVPDEAARHKLFVENPRRLYGFGR
ncbi:MAG: amidohydrolase family protein [Rhodomicrobium sp.]